MSTSSKWRRKKLDNIDNQKTCVCNEEKDQTLVKCGSANCSTPWWHVECAGLEGISKSAIKSLKWRCSCCVLNNFQHCFEESVGSNSVMDMNKLKSDITAELVKTIPELISAATAKMSNCPIQPIGGTYEGKQSQVRHTLLIKPNNVSDGKFTSTSWADTVKNTLPTQLGTIPVNKSVLTQSGAGFISFPTEESRDLAKQTLKSTFSVESKNKSVETVYPKLRISGIDCSKYNKDDSTALRNAILQKNDNVNELVVNQKKLFEILFIKETKNGGGYAVVKVDPQIRSAIQFSGNKLFIDLTACRVSDRLHLVQCYQCQEFGHKVGSQYCKSKNVPVCRYCSGERQSKN